LQNRQKDQVVSCICFQILTSGENFKILYVLII